MQGRSTFFFFRGPVIEAISKMRWQTNFLACATIFESIRQVRRISWETTLIEIMKPTTLTLRGNHRSLITDYNYPSAAPEDFNTNCGCVSALSPWDISRSYFKNEARYDFLGEAALFAVIILTSFFH
jgi:hypothetical protein